MARTVAYAKRFGFAAPQAISPADQHANDANAAAGANGAIVTWIHDERTLTLACPTGHDPRPSVLRRVSMLKMSVTA
jgi:hypothetical protein